ncbi:MAG: hypothetical protein BWY94_02190 [Actinobacteria bacterium ADurb.BinA094]|nr:MAG: hypothetical protein BWY94_02190 [Actinobacteria bacterium ADurb.BinA094]
MTQPSRAQIAGEAPPVQIVRRPAQLLGERPAVVRRARPQALRPGRRPRLRTVDGRPCGRVRPAPAERLHEPVRVRVFALRDDQLTELVQHLVQPDVPVAQFDPAHEGCSQGAAQRREGGARRRAVTEPHHQLDEGRRAAHRGAPTQARVDTRRPHETHRRAHQRIVAAPRETCHDRLLLDGALVGESEVFEAVLQGLAEVSGGDVVGRVPGRHDHESGRRLDRAEMRHTHDPLVEGRQQEVLGGLRQPVQLVEEQRAARTHGAHERAGDERLLSIPDAEHQRRIEPSGQTALRETPVAVHADHRQPEALARRRGQRGLAASDRTFQQQMTAAPERGARDGHLVLTPDHRSAR